jgi:hypothetical protein
MKASAATGTHLHLCDPEVGDAGKGCVLWDLYQQYRIWQLDKRADVADQRSAADAATVQAAAHLDEKVNRLALICRAMFELMEASGVTEEQLKAKILEIDLRDGQADGRVSPQPRRCPKCGAMMSPRFGRCLFCGYRDEGADLFEADAPAPDAAVGPRPSTDR